MSLQSLTNDIRDWLTEKANETKKVYTKVANAVSPPPTPTVGIRDVIRELPSAASKVFTLGIAPLVEKNVRSFAVNPSLYVKKAIDASTPKVAVSPRTYTRLTGKPLPANYQQPTVAETFNFPLTMGLAKVVPSIKNAAAKSAPVIKNAAEDAFAKGRQAISNESFGDDFMSEIENILNADRIVPEERILTSAEKNDAILRDLERSVYQKIKSESAGADLADEMASQYERFKDILQLPQFRLPSVKERLLNGDFSTFKKEAEARKILSPIESSRLFYSSDMNEDEVLERFKDLLKKESPELFMGKEVAKNLGYSMESWKLPDIGTPFEKEISGLLPKGETTPLLSAGRKPTLREAINIFKKTGKVVDFETVKKDTGKPFVFGETGANFRNIPVRGGAGREIPVSIKKPEDFVMERLTTDPEGLRDIGVFRRANVDVYRNFERVYGDRFPQVKKELLDPFDAAKGKFVDDWRALAEDLKTNIVDKLGIQKGSKLSALVQQFGEGKIPLSQLMRKTKDWQKVVKADEFFRNRYSDLIEWVNATRAKVYPNDPTKIIPKRKDYYRHFQELNEGLEGLKNIFESPASISQSLEGISPFTKPKSKFLSFAQKREGDSSKQDAVGGFLDYIRSASFAVNIDPQIARFRNYTQALRESAQEKNSPIGGFLNFLEQWTNDLAGKTGNLDRAVMESLTGRKGLQVVNWLSSLFKSNAIVGNISSALNQTLSLPLGVADAGPVNFARGAVETFKDLGSKAPLSSRSTFLRERYSSDISEQFNQRLIDQPKKLALWLFNAVEETATRAIWNAQYQRGLSEGAKNALKFADDATKKVVAGRGIGEVPLNQKAKIVQLVSPFQLEVANQWFVFKDWMDEKTFGKFLTFAISSSVLAKALYSLTGNSPGFDPIGAAIEGYTDAEKEGKSVLPRVLGRLAGETISNIPFAQNVVAGLPESMRSEYFGKQDPSRFGVGVPAYSALTNPKKAIFFFGPKWGGSQIRKTGQGLVALDEGGSFDAKGQLQFPTEQTAEAKAKALVFGKYDGTPARAYFDNQLSPLTQVETMAWKNQVEKGNDPLKVWTSLQLVKQERGIRGKLSSIYRDLSLTSEQKKQKADETLKEYEYLKDFLTHFNENL